MVLKTLIMKLCMTKPGLKKKKCSEIGQKIGFLKVNENVFINLLVFSL